MTQALHIFRKDVRHLWPQIVVALMIAAGHAVLDVLQTPDWTPQSPRLNQLANLSGLLLVLAWWNLIAAAIHEEELPGDRQFWVTRPYSWRSLLGAKALFIVAFVNVPLFVSDCFILGTQGFAVVANIPDLLLRQFAVSGPLILPAFALATVTSGIGQFVLALLAVFTGIISERMIIQSFHAQPGIQGDILFAGGDYGTGILLIVALLGGSLWQFARRRTRAVRILMATPIFVIGPALSAIPWQHEDRFGTGKQQLNVSELQLSYDFTRPALPENGTGVRLYSPDVVGGQQGPIAGFVRLPVRVSGLPAAMALIGDGEVAGLKDRAKILGGLQRSADGYVQVLPVEAATLEWIKSHRVDLRTSFRLTVVTDQVRTRVPAQQPTMVIPDVGICEIYLRPHQELPSLICRSGGRQPLFARVSIAYSGFRSEPVQIGNLTGTRELVGGLSPVHKWITPLGMPVSFQRSGVSAEQQILEALRHPGAELLFTPQWIQAQTKREIHVADMDLSQYVSPQ